MSNKTPAQFKKRRYLYFWLGVVLAVVPSVAVTAALLPFVQEDVGTKWGIGLTIVAINMIPLAFNVLHSLLTRFPSFNWVALILALTAEFFTSPVFADYVSTFKAIEWTTVLGGILSCVFFALHGKYKAKDGQAKTMHELGVI